MIKFLIYFLGLFSLIFGNSMRADLTYEFLQMGFSPRAQALGKNYLLGTNGAANILYSPAKIAAEHKNKSFSFSFSPGYLDTYHSSLFYTYPNHKDDFGMNGIGIVIFDMGIIEGRNNSSSSFKTIKEQQIAGIISSSGKMIKNLYWGTSLVVIQEQQTKNPAFYSLFSLYFNENNIQSYSGSITIHQDFSVLRLATDYWLNNSWQILLQGDYYLNSSKPFIYHLGVVYKLTDKVELLIGYCPEEMIKFGFTNSLSDKVRLDYAAEINDIGILHQFAILFWM